jgi:RNA polymerase sigma factor (sigma-70 family)
MAIGKAIIMATDRVPPVLEVIRKLVASDVTIGTDAQLLSRFVGQRDEAAFAALVRRHGPMILGVCRRVLHNAHDAEDAYQATFLVLARKAKAIARPEALGNWLYGVAYRTALKARVTAARRYAQEKHSSAAREEINPIDELVLQEIRLLLDQEVSRLPERYRMPFVLCHLAGRTHDEAAQSLGCPRKTITTRLTRAREKLRARLVRRGLVLSAATFAAALSQSSASAAGTQIPVVDSTVRGAIEFAGTTATAAGTVSAPVAALTRGVLTSMIFTKLRAVLAVSLAIAVLATGAGLATFYALAGGTDAKQVAVPIAVFKAKAVAEPAIPKSDQQMLLGTWLPTSGEQNGEKLPEEKYAGGMLTFTDGKVVLRQAAGQEQEGTWSIDSEKNPKEIDMAFGGKTRMGIYELKGDTLKVAFAEFGRPTAFESSGATFMIFNREKKDKSDKELLEGTWIEESRGANGEKTPENDRWKLVFDGDKATWFVKGKTREGIFTIDPDQKPKEIDLTLANPTLVLNGIYELKGDVLKTLWRENDRGGLPKTFDPKEGVLIVLKKKK